MKIPKSNAEKEDLAIELTVNPDLVPCTFESNIKDIENHKMCAVTVDILPQTIQEEVQISVCVQSPLMAMPEIEFYSDLQEATSFTTYVFINEACEIPSLNIEIVAMIVSNVGMPKTLFKSSILPLNLVYELCRPQKDSAHKITININQSPASLATLFPGELISTV